MDDKVPFERALSYQSDQFSQKIKEQVKCFSSGKWDMNQLGQSPIFMTD